MVVAFACVVSSLVRVGIIPVTPVIVMLREEFREPPETLLARFQAVGETPLVCLLGIAAQIFLGRSTIVIPAMGFRIFEHCSSPNPFAAPRPIF
jgi:hypothetical protein